MLVAVPATLFVVKLPTSPLPCSATTTLFGYRKLADAVRQVESRSEWMRPDMEVVAVTVAAIEATGDERVGMAPGASVLTSQRRKLIKGGANY